MKLLTLLILTAICIFIGDNNALSCEDSFEREIEGFMRNLEDEDANAKDNSASELIERVRILKSLNQGSFTRSNALSWLMEITGKIPEKFSAERDETLNLCLTLSGKDTPAELSKATKAVEQAQRLKEKVFEFSRAEQAEVAAELNRNFSNYAVFLIDLNQMHTTKIPGETNEQFNERWVNAVSRLNFFLSTALTTHMHPSFSEAFLLNPKIQKLLKNLLVPQKDSLLSPAQQFINRGVVTMGLDAIEQISFSLQTPEGISRIYDRLKEKGEYNFGYEEARKKGIADQIEDFAMIEMTEGQLSNYIEIRARIRKGE